MGVLKILKAIFKPLFSLFLGLMLLVFGVLWAAWIVSFISAFPFLSYIGPSPFLFSSLGGIALFFTVGIPILWLMLLITRWFSSYRLPSKWRTNLRLGWVASFVLTILTGFGTAMSFNHEADLSHSSAYTNSSDILKISQLPTKYNKPIGILSLPDLVYTRGGLINENVHVDVVKSESDEIIVETKIHSHGKSFMDAQNLANSIRAEHKMDNDMLKLPKDFRIVKGSKFRGQHIQYIIHVPEGKEMEFDESIADIIWHYGNFRDGTRPRHIEKYKWTMTDKGLASVGWDKEYRAEKLMDVKSVENLNIDGRLSTSISYGDKTEILLKGPKSAIDKIQKVETDGTTSLIVEGRLRERVTLEIKTPKLKTLQAKGVRSLKIEGFKQKEMELNFSGEQYYTDVKIYVDVENLTCNIGGSNEVVMLGSGKDLTVNILDGSKITAEHYKAENVVLKGNIYSNSSFYASESFECPSHERHSIKLYGGSEIAETSDEIREERVTESITEESLNPQ